MPVGPALLRVPAVSFWLSDGSEPTLARPGHTSCLAPAPASSCSQPCCCCCLLDRRRRRCNCRILRRPPLCWWLLLQVVSLNLIHEAKLHTNREIMVREQEMLLEDLAAFILTMSTAAQAPHTGSSPNSPEHLQGTLLPLANLQQQQQQAPGMLGLQHQQLHGTDGQQMQQHDVLQQLLMQQQQLMGATAGVDRRPHSGQVSGLMQVIRGWTVQVMLEQVFPVSTSPGTHAVCVSRLCVCLQQQPAQHCCCLWELPSMDGVSAQPSLMHILHARRCLCCLQEYIKCLQQLLRHINGTGSTEFNSGSSNASAAAAHQAVEAMVLQRREMTDRLALFSHYYWAVWCYNKGELAAQGTAPPAPQLWAQVLQSLNLRYKGTREQTGSSSSRSWELLRQANDNISPGILVADCCTHGFQRAGSG